MEENNAQLPIGEADRAHLEKAGKWAKFIAIVYFVGIGLGVVGVAFVLLAIGAAGVAMPGTGVPGAIMPGMTSAFGTWYFVTMLCALLLVVLPTYYLYRFGSCALAAVRRGDEAAMSHSLANLGRYFRFLGIYMIVMFALGLLLITVSVIVGIGMAAAGMGGM